MPHESSIRLAAFIGVLAVMALWESLVPRRARVASRWRRSVGNLLLGFLGALVVRVLPFLSAVAAASWAARQGVGLLNRIDAPAWAEIILAMLALDLVIYGQHVATHRWRFLWRFHKVHHADLDLDATSGLRFHPVEILFSMCLKIVAVVLLGAAAKAVVLFEVGLNAAAMFNHANIRLPSPIDRGLRWIVVTPDMHRVHHSILREETDRNFGFNLPWWDWLFGTYQAQPRDPHEHLTLGLPALRTEEETVPCGVLLAMPFSRDRENESGE
ncbi:MAG: sterol desaturase family protein [Pirellulales bacterium]